jgi:outer membrane protein OmpA-like peptidoglycan-associated protein
VEFKAGRDTSLPGSIATLHAVQSILSSHPEIVLTRVEGHADDIGTAAQNQELARRRARAAARWLVAHGIAAERLLLFACGQRYPIVDERPKTGDQRNRRVEFYVLDPAPAAPIEHVACEPVAPR